MEYKYREKQLKQFFDFMNERHSIYVKKKNDQKWPWTKDKILQTYKFTNVFRQLDKVTEQWTDRWIRLLCRGRPITSRTRCMTNEGKRMTPGDILFHVCMFRFFNWPETYDALYYGMSRWDMVKAVEILRVRKYEQHEQLFTGAYIVTGGGKDQPKHETICEALDILYKKREDMAKRIIKGIKLVEIKGKIKRKKHGASMELATNILQEIPTQGPFTSYEVACDLRHTKLLAHAKDINSWANAGPGAKRGIHRLLTGDKDWDSNYRWPDVVAKINGKKTVIKRKRGEKPVYNTVMRDLLIKFQSSMSKEIKTCDWPFEMREIEHSLCEFDKWSRVKNNEGRRPRSLYRPKLNDEGSVQLKLDLKAPWIGDDE